MARQPLWVQRKNRGRCVSAGFLSRSHKCKIQSQRITKWRLSAPTFSACCPSTCSFPLSRMILHGYLHQTMVLEKVTLKLCVLLYDISFFSIFIFYEYVFVVCIVRNDHIPYRELVYVLYVTHLNSFSSSISRSSYYLYKISLRPFLYLSFLFMYSHFIMISFN